MNYLTDRDVADQLGISWEQVQQRCRTGQWPHIKIGRYYRFTQAHVERIAALHEVARVESPAETWGRRTRQSS